MKKIILFALAIASLGCAQNSNKKMEKDENNEEIKTQWVNLFDGKTFDGWHQYNKQTMSKAWEVQDGAMVFNPEKSIKFGRQAHDIVTDKEYTNFELSLEWKISEKGNSGLFWGVKEDPKFHSPYLTGPEIQVLDNERHPDAFVNPKYHQAGALYDIMQPMQDVCKPANEWNHFLLNINHKINRGTLKLNDTEILNFPLSGPEWEELISTCKFVDKSNEAYTEAPMFGKFKTGKIGLQDHRDKVSYRNIKIREL